MKILVDTNLLLRMSNKQHPMFQTAFAAMRWIVMNGHEAMLVPQVLYEYWAVATRPVENNGLGYSTAEANTAVLDWLDVCSLVDDGGVFPLWHNLVSTYDVKGKPSHDARLVAAMERHGLTEIMTFNKADFAKFPAIRAMSPADVSTGISR
jgi:predicted nucleic acid-binding protein